MYESLLSFPGAYFGEFERLRRELDDVFSASGVPTSIRSVAPGTYPALNIGNLPGSVEVYAFAPGLDPSKVEVLVDRGVLTISGEREATSAGGDAKVSIYSRERPSGKFRRAVSLPDDADPDKVKADYRDGVLHVTVARREAAKPTRVAIQ
jgi:HSP20 family protein